MDTPVEILERALKLNPADRYLIIEGLINSLDEPNKTLDEIWAIEAEKRFEAFKAGRVKSYSYDEVFDPSEGYK